jgi:hypothetical protein
MKKFIALLIGCSLALVAGTQAAQENPDNPNNPKNKSKTKPVQKQQFTPKQQMRPHTQAPTVHPQYKNKNNPVLNNPVQNPVHNPVQNNPNNISKKQFNKWPSKNNPSVVQPNNVPVVRPNQLPAVQPDKFHVNKTVKNFQPRHTNFHARVNSSVASAHFNQNFRIRNAENWKGNHYNAFRTYHPQWHDKGWWHSHHNHIVLIGGGWYFWNAGYWYPAWGYDDSAAYYPYDGPIYVGDSPKPFDQIVADVQTTLQEQGYYKGEVDGLVGPLTQEALAAYQSAEGLEPTAAIDQPTLESLGMG